MICSNANEKKMGDRHLLLFMAMIFTVHFSEEIETNQYNCPQKCDCLGKLMDCAQKKLNAVPTIPKWVERLDLSLNELNGDITEGFDILINLKILKLNENLLQSIPDFSQLQQVKEISLNKNNIGSIKAGCFSENSSIEVLHLNNNHIEVIETGALNNLTNLIDLKINRNEIKSLPNHLFKYQSRLRTLELNHNKLHVINAFIFRGLDNLTTLKLKFNDIDNIMDGAFFGFKSLNILHLDHNKISSISKGWMYGLEYLTSLSLSNNLITTIDTSSWELCGKLEILDLSHNHIYRVESKTFQYLVKLQTLNLSHNKILWTAEDSMGPFSKLQNLVSFNLASNDIKAITSRAFEGLNNVFELDLRNNNITKIQQQAFGSMVKLRKLYLNTSSLLCDCNLLWIVKWLKEKTDPKYVTATCAYPAESHGIMVKKLTGDSCGDSPRPKIVEHPKKHVAIKGRSATLVCAATSNPFSHMTFLWKKNNGNVSNDIVFNNITTTASGQQCAMSVLTISNVTYSDAGKYQCVVSNSFTTTYSNKVKLDIVTFPRFIKLPANVTVKTGETATLNCAATGDPTPEISLKKDGGNDFPAARERRMNVMPTDHLFFIVNAKTSDMGVYSCAAKNPAGTINANATLTVLEAPSFVRVMEKKKEVTSGESAVLQCMTSGSPKPELEWLKDGSAISRTDHFYFTADDQLLIILNVETSHAGLYECVITNELGTKRDMIELRVLPPIAIRVNEEDMTGIIIITVFCCAVGTSIIWVVIIYHTRRRMASAVPTFPAENLKMTQIVHSDSDSPQVFSDNISEHSSCKDSGTGDSAKQTSFDGVPSDRNEQLHFETVVGSYSPVPEAHKLLPSSFKPSIQVCVNNSVTPATYSFSSHSGHD